MVGHGGEAAVGVGQEDAPTGRDLSLGPRLLARDRLATGTGVDQFQAGQRTSRGCGVVQLDVLIGAPGATGHDLTHDQPVRHGPVDRVRRSHARDDQ